MIGLMPISERTTKRRKMKNNLRSIVQLLTALIIGWTIGASGLSPVAADDVSPTPTSYPITQGEILSICIDKKTGAMRASLACKKTERATIISGQGEKGDKGDTGPQGIQGLQGLQGERGLTGATGSVTGLRTKTISTLSTGWGSSCTSGFSGPSLLNGNTSLSTWGSTISLSKSCTNLNESSVTVYVP